MRYLTCVAALLTFVQRDDLSQAVGAVAGADSYSFTLEDGTPKSAVQGKYHKAVPLFLKADGIEFFRMGDVLVYGQGDQWQRTRTGTVSDPLRILGASAKVRAARVPHEELAQVYKALTDIVVIINRGKGGTTHTGKLSEKAAKELARSENRDLAWGGTAYVWLDDKGQVAGYGIAITVKGKRGNADVDGVMTRTVTLSEVGATKLELPAAAKKALE